MRLERRCPSRRLGAGERCHLAGAPVWLLRALLAGVLVGLVGCAPVSQLPTPSPAASIAPPAAAPTPAPAGPAAPQPPTPGPPPPTSVGASPHSPREPLVERARADAASRSGISPARVRVIRVEDREWRDSSLGCPTPGARYAQVITPGYLILLEAEGRELEYHADRSGRLVLCQGGRPA